MGRRADCVLREQVIREGIVSSVCVYIYIYINIYITKLAGDVLRLARGACRAGANTPGFEVGEEVGEEGGLVHELLWEVISFLIRWRKSRLFPC